RLVAKDGSNAQSKSYLAAAYIDFGKLLDHMQRPEDALEVLKKALALRQQLAHTTSSDPAIRQNLADGEGFVADELVKLKRLPEALQLRQGGLCCCCQFFSGISGGR